MLPRPLHQWSLYFVVAFSIVFAGFWPNFFAALATNRVPHLVHGFSATAWMLLPVVQSWLIRTRRRAWHRTLGYASLVLAPVVVLSGLYILQLFTLRNLADFQLRRFKFVYLDLTGLLLFSLFVALAMFAARRRDYALHLRLVAASALIPMEAVVERLLINVMPRVVPNFEAALYAALIFMEIVLVLLVAGELRWRRLRWPYPLLLGYYVFVYLTVELVAASPAFQRFAWAFARWGT